MELESESKSTASTLTTRVGVEVDEAEGDNTSVAHSEFENEDRREIGCQTEPNLINKLIDNSNFRKQRIEDVDLYQEYVRSAQCPQFWPFDKNPIRTLVPSMIKVELPEQHLKNESLMFDLVQAISNNSKLVNLLAKYIHHIVPNVIISKRIDLIPLITCTIRVCREPAEQERLVGLLFNLIKRPNEEQRRMILSGMIVTLQVSPSQSNGSLLPNLWDHVSDKFPERRILLAESCAVIAHYVSPALRTNLILSILIQLLKDKNGAVRSAACKSFACLLTLIMDRNDEVFDVCLNAAEDLIQDVLQQTPMSFCEHRYELEEMRYCALETVYTLINMWAVKLNRFKHELADRYMAKAEKYLANLLSKSAIKLPSPLDSMNLKLINSMNEPKIVAAAEVARRRSMFFESRNKRTSASTDSGVSINSKITGGTPPSPIRPASLASNLLAAARRQSAFVTSGAGLVMSGSKTIVPSDNQAIVTTQKAVCAYLKMLTYLVPFVFADSVHSCAWLSRPASSSGNSSTHSDQNQTANVQTSSPGGSNPASSIYLNKLLDPNLIIDESSISAFHDQIESMHLLESLDWMLEKFLPNYLKIIATFSFPRLQNLLGLTTNCKENSSQICSQPENSSILNHSTLITDILTHCLSSIRNLCLLFGLPLTKSRIRPILKSTINAYKRHDLNNNNNHNNSNSQSANQIIDIAPNSAPITLYAIQLAALTSFEPVEQAEFEQLISIISEILALEGLTRIDVEMLAISIRLIATNPDQIQSPTTRQKFLSYTLDALVRHNLNNCHNNKVKPKEYILIVFRQILTCLIDPVHRPADWASILVSKFLPTLINLANDSTDVYICTYARLMCAKLVETFDLYFDNPKLTKEQAAATLPALESLKALTEQIKASNLNRQIQFLLQEYNEKF